MTFYSQESAGFLSYQRRQQHSMFMLINAAVVRRSEKPADTLGSWSLVHVAVDLHNLLHFIVFADAFTVMQIDNS